MARHSLHSAGPVDVLSRLGLRAVPLPGGAIVGRRLVHRGGTLAYRHTNSKGVTYYLHRTSVTLRGGKPQTIYFFAKVERNEKGEPTDLPEDRVVKENPRNGFLSISQKNGGSRTHRHAERIDPRAQRSADATSMILALEITSDSVDPVLLDDVERFRVDGVDSEFALSERHPVGLGSMAELVRRLREMINTPGLKEGEYQELLEDHPELLLFDPYDEAIPHVALSVPMSGKLRLPDFLIRDCTSDLWDILELKRPDVPITRLSHKRPMMTSHVQEAIAQVREYQDILTNAAESTRLQDLYGLAVAHPRAYVIIGRSSSDPKVDRAAQRDAAVNVRSWDFVVNLAERKYGVKPK